MNDKAFTLGSRWYSLLEIELGLGELVHIEGSYFHLYFKQSDLSRIYNYQTADLKRFKLYRGDKFCHINGKKYDVERSLIVDGLYTYLCYDVSEVQSTSKKEPLKFSEKDLSSELELSGPMDKLFSFRFDSLQKSKLRYETLLLKRSLELTKYRGLYNSRVGLLPHQLSILGSLVNQGAKKVILCDEVGLGKTIEALNYLNYLIETNLINSALIIVPDGLQYQWFIELYKKYNLLFKTLGAKGIVEVELEYDNTNFLITSLEYLNSKDQDNSKHNQDLLSSYDLVIVDEAHRLALYREDNSFVNKRLNSDVGETDINLKKSELTNYIKKSIYTMLLSATPEALGERFFSALKKLCKTSGNNRSGPLLFRNRRETLEKTFSFFPQKNLIKLFVDSQTQGLNQKTYLLYKVKAILPYLGKDKTLVITHSKDEALKIKKELEYQSTVKMALFHSQMSLVEKDRQCAYFQDTEEGASVLICTEAGSEGRNFEFASNLILMDIPLNPTHLIQRIGRLDRIGQKKAFNIITPIIKKSIEENILTFYELINAFSEFPKGIEVYYERVKEKLKESITTFDNEMIKNLAKNYRLFVDELKQKYSETDSNSFSRETYLDVLNGYQKSNEKEVLYSFCDNMNIDIEELNQKTFSLKQTTHTLVTLPSLQNNNQTYTFSRDLFLVRDDIKLISKESSLFKEVFDTLVGSDFGNCSLKRSQINGMEFIYSNLTQNMYGLNLNYIFPLTPMRVMLDFAGSDITRKYPRKLLYQSSSTHILESTEVRQNFYQENRKKISDKLSEIISREHLKALCSEAQKIVTKKFNHYKESSFEKLNDISSISEVQMSHIKKSSTLVLDSIIIHISDDL